MSVKAKFVANLFGPFYSRTNSKSVEYQLESESTTIKDLVEKIIEQYPAIKEFIFDGDELAENTMIVKFI